MVNKVIKKVSGVNSLSLSYNDVIERITGSKRDSFKIPSSIIKDREKFWDKFFFKYSEQEFKETELDIFTLKPCREESQKSIVETKKELVCKPLSVIQYWINTGYLPYKILYMNKDKLDVGLFTEKSASSSHSRSSSSSVDTAAYILSNMNVTNKVETMAIIEGAKDNSVITSQNAQDIEIIQDKMHKTNNENIILKNNNGSITLENNDNIISNHMLQRKNINVEEYITKAQRNSDDDNIDILSETINTDNETTNKYKSDYNKLLTNKMLMHTFDDINRNSHIEQNVKLSNAEEPYSIKENRMWENSFTKIGRKKLYSGRDSPVDLIRTESSSRSTISISNQSLHPALDFGCNSKKFKIYNKRKMYHSAPFHKLINNSRLSVSYYDKRKRRIKKRSEQKFKTSLTNGIENTVSTNQNIKDSSVLNQYLVKGKTDKCANSSLYKKQANKQKKFNESINCLQEMNIEKYQKTNNTTKEWENLNPLICLTRLSNDDIAKYKKLKKTTNINNLDTIRLQEVNTERHKKSNKMTNMKHLVVYLSRLSKRDIEKYKKPNNKLNLNPIVRLKRLSELEIQKYTKSINITKSFDNLDTVTSLNRILNKSGALKSTQLQNDNVNDVNQLFSSNIMNLVTDDTTSESSVFICKCDNISFDDCSVDNLSMSSKSSLHSYSTSTKNHMLEIEERFYNKRKRLNSEVRNKKVDTSKACVKKGVKRINNEKSLKLNTSKNNLKRKYATRNRKYTKVYSMDNSFNNNSKTSDINKDVHHTNDIASCPDEPRIVFENNNANANKNKKRQYITFSSDEDDEFIKLVHCSEDTQKSKQRQQHKTLNKNFNTVEKLGTILSNQSFSESPIKDTRFKRMNENCNQKLIKAQTEIKNQTKLLPINKKRKSLCFRTKIFDSDSESLTTS
ncbi:uncharacterized protein MAL13P1.304-like [Frieseomelitta varia]|uniref:uncharacterized protein MAL13P1.304-like n=1 Tax=Frieseomelitta varia TaxID=561572 RepID=UPI001CB6B56D|nr:uncharacterized protein MAL13P1.304-like [Frieseomelitta varia]